MEVWKSPEFTVWNQIFLLTDRKKKARREGERKKERKGGISLWGWLKIFLVVMYECESWTIKKAEHQRIDALNCGAGEDS